MRAATVVFALLAVATSVVAQGPKCIATCSSTPPPPDCLAKMPDTDAVTKCACGDKTYVAASTSCLEVTCESAKEFTDAQMFAISVCANLGVALKPSGTWKGPSSGSQTPSGSATTPSGAPTGSPSATPTGGAVSRAFPAAGALAGGALFFLAL